MLRIKLSLLCLALAALVANVQAADDYFNIADGNWSDTTKWSLDAVPAAGDTAYIVGGFTATVDVDTNALGVLNLGDATGDGTVNQSANTLTVNGPMTLGASTGVGTYNLSGGTLVKQATANGQSIEVGNGAGVSGSIAISGAGWLDVQDEQVSLGHNGGTGTLTMTDDAKITLDAGTHYSDFYIGLLGGTGEMTMSDNASLVSTRSNGLIVIGGGWNWSTAWGFGTLTMSGHSSINTSGALWIGSNTNGGAGGVNIRALGTVTVNSGCSITTGNNIFVGQQWGEGVLNVEGGTVTKGGSGDFKVGSLGGKGTVNLNSGAIYNNSRIYMAQWFNPDNLICTFNLNGGLVQATQIDGDTGSAPYAIFNFNGGTLQAMASSSNYFSTNVTARVQAGGAKIDTHAYDITFNAMLEEDPDSPGGGLTKLGAGTLKLTNMNTYTGPTTVEQGSLIVNYLLSASSTVTVKSGASLGGTASTIGPIVVEATGHIAPGDNAAGAAGIGTIYADSLDITDAQLDYQIESTSWDQVAIYSGTFTANGMNIFNLSSSTPGSLGAGDYPLITFNTISMGDTFENTFGLSISSLGAFETSLVENVYSIDLRLTGILIEWQGPDGGNYNNTSNWTTGVVPNGVGAIAKFGTASYEAGTVNLDISPTVGRLIFNNYASYDISGTNALNLNAGSDAEIIDSSGSHTISAPVTLFDNLVVSVENNFDTLTISGSIGENGDPRNLTKEGSGILVLSNSNTYSGNTTVNAGTLELDGPNAYTGATTVSNATLIAKIIANADVNSSIGAPSTTDPSKLVIDNSTFNYIGTGAASTDRGISLANNVTIGTDQNLAFNGTTVLSTQNVTLNTPGPGVVTFGGQITTVPAILYFYKEGTGALRYNAGADVTSTLASGSGTDLVYIIQNGDVIIDGTPTTQYNIIGGELNIGSTSSTSATSLTINGGTVSVAQSWFSIGQGSSFDTTLTMTGGVLSSYWAAFGNAMGASPGNQYLNLSGDSSLQTTNSMMMLAYSPGSTTTVAISDNAQMSSASYMTIGNAGTGIITISDNAQVSSATWMSIGLGGTGSVTVNGADAGLSSGTDLNVGDEIAATGTLDILDGNVQTTNLWIARNGDDTSISTGTVNQSGGAVVTTNLTGGGGAAVYNLDGGSLTANIIQKDPASTTGTMTLNFNGGVLKAGASDDPTNPTTPTWFLSGLTAANVKAGGAIIDSNSFAITIDQVLQASEESNGGLTKQGLGTLTLAQDATYTGDTVVEEGTLDVLHIDTPSAAVLVAAGDNELTAVSIVSNSLTVGAGAKVVIKPLSGGNLSGLTAVPEPGTLVLLAIAALVSLVAVWRKK
jgi:fibronectin-binding autotransporter adhesin